jgi:hypothetical protein
MQLDYNQARFLEGRMISFKNENGEWSVGRVVRVKKEGFEIEELTASHSEDGYGFGFWGGPFWGPPAFVPFVGVAFAPFFLW